MLKSGTATTMNARFNLPSGHDSDPVVLPIVSFALSLAAAHPTAYNLRSIGMVLWVWLLHAIPRIHCSISENFHIVYTNETGELSLGVTPACGGVELSGVAVLPVPRSLEGWLDFERNG